MKALSLEHRDSHRRLLSSRGFELICISHEPLCQPDESGKGQDLEKSSGSRDTSLDCARGREKKKIQEILRGDGTHVLVAHTSVRTPTTQLAHSVCRVHPQERGPRRTSSHRGKPVVF